MTRTHPTLSVTSAVHAWDDTPITIEHVNESTDAIHLFGPTRDGLVIYAGELFMRRLRDRLSVALGDNGVARIAGIHKDTVVWVDDNGQHAVLLDELAELDDCAHCDLPATNSNDLDQPTCVGHA